MVESLNIDNSNEKIKKFLRNVINQKNKDGQEYMTRLNSQLEELKKQEETGIILSNNNPDIELNAKYILGAITSIAGDILYGFGEAAKHIKDDVIKRNNLSGGANNANENTTDINNTSDVAAAQDEVVKHADSVGNLLNKVKTDLSSTAVMAKDVLSDISMKDLLSDMYSGTKQLGINALKTGFMWSEDYINSMIDLALDAVGEGDLANTPWNKLSPDLNKKLLLFATILKELSDNPATKEAVRDIAESIAVSLVDILEELQPEVNQVTDQVIKMLRDVASKSVRGATSTGLSIAQAFLAEIPFVGGILDLMIAIGKGFNALLATYKILVTRYAELGVQGVQTIVTTEKTVHQGVNRVKDTINKASKQLKNTLNNESSIQSGGQSIKHTQGCITRCENRLRKSIKLFNSTLPKQKMTYKNKLDISQHKSKKNRFARKRITKKKK